jgi:hypothetical protein
MDNQKMKRAVFFIGALFVAIIFITSYAAFSSNNSGGTQSTTTTVSNARTLLVSGIANAVVSNYTYIALVGPVPANQIKAVNNTLNNLQFSGAISNILPSNASYRVILSTINPYQLYLSLSNATSGANVMVASQAEVTLPNTIEAYYYGSSLFIPVHLPQRVYPLYLANVLALNSTLSVRVSILITSNGSVYQNQVELTKLG